MHSCAELQVLINHGKVVCKEKAPPPFNFHRGPPFPKTTTVYIAYILHLLTFVTNPPTTVIYNLNFTIPYTKSWLLLEPCTTESTPTLKNDQKVNLMVISQKKRCSQWFPCKILFLQVKPACHLVLN